MHSQAPSPAALGEIARQIAVASHAREVVLFGSRATGTGDEQSDVDLALVFDRPEMIPEGLRQAHRVLWPRRFPVDLVPITADALRRGTTLLAREIARTGTVLYGDSAA
jgi:predicted nucleotidyltransferase